MEAKTETHQSRRSRLLHSRKVWLLVLLLVLIVFGTRQYERLILAPPDDTWRPVTPADLGAEHWYATAEGLRLTEELQRATESPPLRFLTGLYYREYKNRYSPGIKNTQYVKVGRDQYPAIHDMVVDACNALGAIEGDPVPVPSVYVGWTGQRAFEVTNFTNPSLVIGNDFLWAFKPEELRYLIARQVGHLHCRHVYFLDVNKGLRALLNSALPDVLVRVIIGGVGGNLLDWSKEAHITADRAGLLVTGDVDVATQALIKLNIMASLDDFYGQPNPEAFAAQARTLDQSRVTMAGAALAELRNPNPFLTIRVGDLLRFHQANESLFKDRNRTPAVAPIFDPGIPESPTSGGE
ncbi:MAG TPA: M48 family metallopeptidase [Candidatus Krumholzibacteria bacterium]|nr:M48 family metallopeptidase [Candidatus Krumholzibacteria bacterium]HPD71554.1 M48 family metallopeptidase [Candidatus Krumholzibacteria bacterium]HRY41513.1 M48 family metallopeptidase [Candidatus Krumholzibacteria bacterium]